jgi:hypothetical protein
MASRIKGIREVTLHTLAFISKKHLNSKEKHEN